jgi:hypothetical protein
MANTGEAMARRRVLIAAAAALMLEQSAALELCDDHGLCSVQHDWVGLGGRSWPEDRAVRREPPAPVRCRLGDPFWSNDCVRPH